MKRGACREERGSDTESSCCATAVGLGRSPAGSDPADLMEAWILYPPAAATHPALGDRAVHIALFQSSFTGLSIACFASHTAGLNSLVGKLFCGCIRITWSNSHIHTASLGQLQPLFQGSFILGAV